MSLASSSTTSCRVIVVCIDSIASDIVKFASVDIKVVRILKEAHG